MNGGTAAVDRRGPAQIGVALERLTTNFRISITAGFKAPDANHPGTNFVTAVVECDSVADHWL